MRDERPNQSEFANRQRLWRLVFDVDEETAFVDPCVAQTQYAAVRRGRSAGSGGKARTAQGGRDTCEEFADAEGLGDEVVVVTSLEDTDFLPSYGATDNPFLGREIGYGQYGSAVFEAMDLVTWISDTATYYEGYEDILPADYNTATLREWLADADNAYLYAYWDDLEYDDDFVALTVDGTNFVYNAPSDDELSISVSVVGCYDLTTSDWSEDNLTQSEEDETIYNATDETDTCFARLRYSWDW